MGNQLVIPSQGDWYEEPLRRVKITVKNCIDSGTFFLTLNCVDQFSNEPKIVKAYEYVEPLDKIVITDNCRSYFKHLADKCKATQGIINYEKVFINDRYAFLIRPKFQYTLSERLEEYPRLETVEKMWVVFQIVSSIISLHSLGLVHNALNPDNIFCDWDTRVSIGDMAPFKPTHIRKDKPNVFYHYFSTSSRTGCYLAPEQIIGKTSIVEHLIFNNPSFASDFFSIGCIIYYIFTGHDLFTFSSLIEYSERKKTIDDELNELPTCIRSFAKNMLNVDPNARIPLELLHETFPSCFHQIFSQFLEFFTNDGSLAHFVTMIPVFNALVDEQDVEVRIILTNLFSRFILTSNDQSSIITFSFFLVDFAAPLSEEIILCRILPNIVGLLSFNSASIVSTGLRCLVKLLESCRSVNEDLQSIIENYIINEVLTISTKSNLQIRCTMAETAPKFLLQVNRLIPKSLSNIISMCHFIINETDTSVVSAFLFGLEQCTGGGYSFLSAIFPVLLSSFNYGIMMYKSKLLQIIMSFYEQASEKDRKQMRELLVNLTQATLGFIQHETHEEMLLSFLNFLNWSCSIDLLDDTLIYDLFGILVGIIDTGERTSRIITQEIIDKLPKRCKDSTIPCQIMHSINKSASVFTVDDNVKEVFKTRSPDFTVPLLPLISKKNSVLTPKLVYSTRITHKKVTSLAEIDDIIMISTGHELMGLSSDTSTAKLDKSENTILSISAMKQTKQAIVAYDNATSFYDVVEMKMFDLTENKFDHVKSINSRIYMTSKENTFSIWDIRAKSSKPVYQLKLDESLNISDFCSWDDNCTLFGIGCKEGITYALDSRVWKPVSMCSTPPVKTIVPAFGGEDSQCLAFVSSDNFSCCIDVSKQAINATANLGGFGYGYLGRVVLTSDEGTFFIDTSNYKKSFMLFDISYDRSSNDSRTEGDRILPMTVEEIKNGGVRYDLKINKNSLMNRHLPALHGHSSHITAFTHCNHFISGDDQGFVNIWSL